MATGNPSPSDVADAALKLGRELSPEQSAGLATYLGLLQTWNRKTNLVGPRVWPQMLSELAADSWHLAELLDELALPVSPVTLDFGAGAGIPGVPLRLFWKTGRYVMIEPRAIRAGFLRQCVAMMRLQETEVFEGRAEAFKACADVCLSRAFQPWREFLKTASGHGSKTTEGGSKSTPSTSRYSTMEETGRKTGTDETTGYPVVIVFSNEASPDGPVPEGFVLVRSKAYPSRGGVGYFWVFAPSI
jgi:16S rRNA (guanine527-N7)-methyltransferase